MFAVIVLLLIVDVIGCRIGASAGAGAGARVVSPDATDVPVDSCATPATGGTSNWPRTRPIAARSRERGR